MSKKPASANSIVYSVDSGRAMQRLTIKLRLRDKHSAELNRQARAVNFVWNYCNETSGNAWRRDRRWLSGFDLGRLTAGSSKELDLHAHTIKNVCQQFSRSRDKAKRASIRWRGRRSLGWVPFNTGHVSFDGDALKFRGHCYHPMHLNPRLKAGMKIGASSFNADSKGRWYINLTIEVECANRAESTHVGVDLGLKDLATLSNGKKIEMPRLFRSSEEMLATAQRAGKSKRSRAIHRKIANRRKDFLHKASTALAKEYGLIVIGDVSPSKLAQTRMAKSVLDAGWSDFKRMLSYKAIMHGGGTIEVSERLTTQTCSECGSLPPSRPKGIAGLGIRGWECSECGAVHDRDVNAAKNILRVGLDTLAVGAST
ncbi:transposase [Nitratireductor aquimarinus]|uniref:RNA-guided endonuclease InsQ/TnpB family protein n=1 Tax=Alphaproteobacteria TaxID=28211 RepID=UPI0019D3CF26|nr:MULTISPECIES: RNA-guided endonuclease TnpB family protein [Alphaproteobacteria]MBN7755473.1 transposase [Nitratireductor aquimarinus]MBY5998228.1 transposase [Tritonibacter mobilis]MBY6020256.1 transposase [Nitratireductor sp. DP7N14-4]